MKKLLLLSILLTIAFNSSAQDEQVSESKFPYEKILKMTDEGFKDAKFKFDDNMNQWVLTKYNGLNQTVAILGALNGSASNYIPHVNDYKVIVQKGLTGIASVDVVFYDDQLYHKILTFAADKGSDLLETSSGKLTKTQFNYGGYSFVLNVTSIKQSASVARYGVLSSRDQSYDAFCFTILTGEKPSSKWLTKEAAKQAKRDAKGRKKQSAGDLM